MDQALEAILYPYVTAPRRVALDAIEALVACPVVERIALFGSIAEEQHDGWSDVDLMVVVPDEDAAWHAVDVLHRLVPMRWHGPFSTLLLPSGRLWPLGESPFHSIDLSLVSHAQYETARREGVEGHPAVFREVHVREAPPGDPPRGRPDVPLVTAEYDFTHALHIAAKRMKAYLRAEGDWAHLAEAMKALESAWRDLAHRPPGSDPDDLMTETRTLYYALMQERAQYGGEYGGEHGGAPSGEGGRQ